jgi:hypothetical protein
MDNTDNNNSKKQYPVLPYTQREFPLSPEIRYPGYGMGGPSEDVHLRDYLYVILKRKWIVFAFFISSYRNNHPAAVPCKNIGNYKN